MMMSNLFNRKILNIDFIAIWLSKNKIKYEKSEKPINCIARTLPCMCFVREENCIFIDIYEKLTKKHNDFLDEKYLENELNKYHEIKDDNEKTKNWLTNNLQIGFSKFSWFSNASKYANLRLSFINGKNENEFEFIKFQIDGNDFKNNYDFAHLFCDLFFNKEILPNELAKWKYENEITD